jgi:hypothetical protein
MLIHSYSILILYLLLSSSPTTSRCRKIALLSCLITASSVTLNNCSVLISTGSNNDVFTFDPVNGL